MTIKAGVIGWPIEHSLSPHIHQFWLDEFGLDGAYERLACEPGPVSFGAFVKQLRHQGYAGCNVTLPHKAHAARVADHKTDLVHRLGVANTLSFTDEGIEADNTDVAGFSACLDRLLGQDQPLGQPLGRALVLGAGGAAPAILEALAAKGAPEIAIANRTPAKAWDLVGALPHLPLKVVDWTNISAMVANVSCVVNATSLGMVGQPVLPISLDRARPGTLVVDIVYTPLETDLLRQAREKSLPHIGGLPMLLAQAAPGFRRWYGQSPEVTPALEAYIKSLLEGS